MIRIRPWRCRVAGSMSCPGSLAAVAAATEPTSREAAWRHPGVIGADAWCPPDCVSGEASCPAFASLTIGARFDFAVATKSRIDAARFWP